MTIKLSTTNSVNKTLQHKALWDLETPYRDVGGQSWLQLRGRLGSLDMGAGSGLQRWYCFSSERDPQDSVSVQEEWDLGSGEHCDLSSSVNKLSISRSKKTLFHTARRGYDGSALPGLTLWNRELLGPSSEDLSRVIKWEMKQRRRWKWAGDYVWILCAVVSSLQVSRSPRLTEKPSGPVASLTWAS